MTNNIITKDADLVSRIIKTTDVGGVHTPHHKAEIVIGGSDVANGNRLPVAVQDGLATADLQTFSNALLTTIRDSLTGRSSAWQQCDAPITRPANTTAYAASKLMGSASVTRFKFTNWFPAEGGSRLLTGLKLTVEKAGGISAPAGFAVRAFVFSGLPTVATADQSDFALLAADKAIRQSSPLFEAPTTGGAGSDCYETFAPLYAPALIKAAPSNRDLYVVLVAQGAFTPTSASIMNLFAAGPEI